MKQYVERMIAEKEELENKIRKAKKAIEVPLYGADKYGTVLLAEQVRAMNIYLEKLNERIEYEKRK